MTELIFFSKPLLLFVPIVFGLLQILLVRIPKPASLAVNAVLFTAAVVLLILVGGQLSDILVTTLFASLLSFVFSENAYKSGAESGKGEEEK